MACTRRHMFAGAVAAIALIVPSVSRGGGSRDHEEARRAVERGEALPLADLLMRVRSQLGGEVVGVSFKRREDRWVYEFKVIASDGALSEVYVDASSAAILRRKER